MLFMLKKVISRLFFPLPMSLIVLVAGVILAWRVPGARRARAALVTALALLFAFSSSAASEMLLRPLESRYPALGPEALAQVDWSEVHHIVVFAGCAVAFEQEPITRQVDPISLGRLMEGIRLYNACPDCTLILSGGGSGCPADVPDAAFTNYRFAATYGVAPEDIVIERESLDTDDQARILAPLLGQEPFLLVTSASHMPRSMALLKAEGVRGAIPAPADFRTGLYSLYSEAGFTINSLYPNAVALWNSERAVYEYLGLLWMHVRGLF